MSHKKGGVSLFISPAWLPKIQAGIQTIQQHQHRFERRTPHLQSPLDGIHIVTDRNPSLEFFKLAQQIGRKRYHYCNPRAAYRKSYSFGCVRVFLNPKWPNMHSVKIYINPSQGAMSLHQVFDWIRFIVGDVTECWVKGVHYKIDIQGLKAADCINNIWWPRYRKNPDYSRYKGRTVYFGTRTSKQQLVVYDKARQLDMNAVLTRIELRTAVDNDNLTTVCDYFSHITELNVFEDVTLINASEEFVNDQLRPFGKRMLDQCISKTLKSLSTYRRGKLLDSLASEGYMENVEPLYRQCLLQWLQSQEGQPA